MFVPAQTLRPQGAAEPKASARAAGWSLCSPRGHRSPAPPTGQPGAKVALPRPVPSQQQPEPVPPAAMQSQGPGDHQENPEPQPEPRRKLPRVRPEGENSGAQGDSPGFRPFEDLAPGALHVRVRDGSKVRNLLSFAMARMELPSTRAIVFSGIGHAAAKTVSCAEILKRRLGGLYQVTRMRQYTGHELGPPPDPWSASRLSADRTVPGISILLSKDPLDPHQPGYQGPGPQPGPSAQPTAPASSTVPEEAATAAGSAQRSSPPRPGAPLEDPRD
ncbi:Ribonuclease P protein subunit p25 [Galemys pyrenaicus]|uniref:Ribonuclease P protein subunit p25 n=1 Tax=Galemys pyrenaicus TaxID=202257 RepID=A0A8J5ZYN0_GALPY|nr:Ribonuclease P protein subunit p25 [Galemys pyrenaicus]